MDRTKWKPEVGETYYIPWVFGFDLDYLDIVWNGYPWDEKNMLLVSFVAPEKKPWSWQRKCWLRQRRVSGDD